MAFEVQSLIFPKDKWDSLADAKKWAKDHDYKTDVDETEDTWRMRQRDPDDFQRLRTICINPDRDTPMDECKVKAVGGPLKSGRSMKSGYERRVLDMEGAELRSEGTEEAPMLKGYAARFNKWSKGLFWKEKIASGAFRKSLQEGDIKALWNHNSDKPLGRVGNDTLILTEDEKGLFSEIKIPATTWGKDAVESVRRGDVHGMSIGFWTLKDEWNDKGTEREIKEAELVEVSPVTFPAYPSTSIAVRSIETGETNEFEANELTALLVKCSRGNTLSEGDRALLDSLELLKDYYRSQIRSAEPVKDHSVEAKVEPAKLHSTEARMRELKILLEDNSNG